MGRLVAAVGEKHQPKVASERSGTGGGGGIVGGYPGLDFVEVKFLVMVVNQSDGEAVGGAVNGVVGVHVACGALPLVGDGEGDGVVGDEEGADVGGVGDGGGVGDESKLHQGGVSTEVGTINAERESVGHFRQPGSGYGSATACCGARRQKGMKVASLNDGLIVDAVLAEVPSDYLTIRCLTVGVPFFVKEHVTVALSHNRSLAQKNESEKQYGFV